MGLIFDLDLTLIDSSIAEPYRNSRLWQSVYNLIPKFIPYPGIIESLHKFKEEGHQICIVTSSPSSYCERVLKHWNIPYDYTVCYHDTSNRKPYPDPIFKALSLLNKPASKALSFGDRDIDIIASNKAGVASVACLWGTKDEDTLLVSKPTHSIKSSEELVKLVQKFYSV